MSQLLPNHKSKIIQNQETGKDSRTDEIIENPDSELGLLYYRADELNSNKLKKRYIEACLICSNDLDRISEIIEVDVEVLKIYSEFFFDVSKWDRLSKVDHIDELGYHASSNVKKEEGNLKLWALSHGLDFIAWRLGKSSNISPVEGLQDLFNVCIYKSKEAMFNTSTSDTSKESVKWVKLSTDISRLLKLWVMDSNAAKRDLEIAIREVLPEFDGLDSLLQENNDIDTKEEDE